MQKIQTLFQRDWEGNRKIINEYVSEDLPKYLESALATEKLDGTNVRLTVRNHTLVRLEKRHNPSKIQKAKGISEPWYADADEYAPNDKFIWEAARNADLSKVPDGEWSGEALGPSIQGNPLNLAAHQVFLFTIPSVREQVAFTDVPVTFEELREWLPKQVSKFGQDCGIEGIVWHCPDGRMFKIKKKDF